MIRASLFQRIILNEASRSHLSRTGNFQDGDGFVAIGCLYLDFNVEHGRAHWHSFKYFSGVPPALSALVCVILKMDGSESAARIQQEGF
jgi:hypothetical protein